MKLASRRAGRCLARAYTSRPAELCCCSLRPHPRTITLVLLPPLQPLPGQWIQTSCEYTAPNRHRSFLPEMARSYCHIEHRVSPFSACWFARTHCCSQALLDAPPAGLFLRFGGSNAKSVEWAERVLLHSPTPPVEWAERVLLHS
jgi:hypothetical protein